MEPFSGEVRKVKLGDQEILLDPGRMVFNQDTLSEYLEGEAAWYDYFGSCLAKAEYLTSRAELEHQQLYAQFFKYFKDDMKCTEKLADANAKMQPDVEQAQKRFLASKYRVRLLQQHLRAWDRAHENAQSRGHFLRKEMDKLNNTIRGMDPDTERTLEAIIQAYEEQPNDTGR